MSDSRDSKGTPASIGPWLRAARLRKDVTEVELARALNTEHSMIAMIEKGEHQPGPELRARITAWIRSPSPPAGRAPRGPYNK